MRNLKTASRAFLLSAGMVISPSLGQVQEEPPMPPQLEFPAACLAEASAENMQRPEMQPMAFGSQTRDLRNWESLKQVSKGKKIRVVDEFFEKTKGRFIAVNEQVLRFQANGKEQILDRANVRMVSLRVGPSTGERILLGILAGALIGAATWAESSQCEKYG